MIHRLSRTVQMCGVLALSFSMSLLGSLLVFFGVQSLRAATSWQLIWNIAFDVLCLGLLYLILLNQKRSLESIGFSASATLSDVLHSVVLFFAALLCTAVVYQLTAIVYVLLLRKPLLLWDGSAALSGTGSSILPVVFVLLNPFFEELLVRGYLMTEIEELFHRPRLALVASVVLQTTYHLYQGFPNACALAAGFTCLAIYFSRTRRLLPVVLTHLYFDVIALLVYSR
jgi:membrane protease YdiL (CAAX protease family)